MGEELAPLAEGTSVDGSLYVTYDEKPWRHYLVNPDAQGIKHKWTPEEPWGLVPSVTQAIGVVDKSGPLQHYASTKTLEGVARLLLDFNSRRPHERSPVRAPYPGAFSELAEGENKEGRMVLIAELLKNSLKRRKLMFYHRTQKAADRGVAVHKVFERWAEQQVIPNLGDFPESQRGYVQGLSKWLMEAQPEVLSTEAVVGSANHGFAGRLDMTIVVRTKGRTGLRDIKTSKTCYPRSHFPQVMAYEHGWVEMGNEPTGDQGIIVLSESGDYREVLARDVEFEDFLTLLRAYRSQTAIPECSECWELRCKCWRDKKRG